MSRIHGPPPECRDPLLTWTLDAADPDGWAAGDPSALRQGVSAHAARQGLSQARCEDLELAVHEGVANVFDHGGGSGRVRLWRAQGLLCCEISDHGPGIPARCRQASMPARDRDDGRGLWLMARLSDSLTVATGPAGTTVIIVVRLPD